jgi:hypothetical protein
METMIPFRFFVFILILILIINNYQLFLEVNFSSPHPEHAADIPPLSPPTVVSLSYNSHSTSSSLHADNTKPTNHQHNPSKNTIDQT